uniref:Electron transporter n=1 Tax=Zea mays TaxID=4577 RepID=A0A804R9B6_MAIZE
MDSAADSSSPRCHHGQYRQDAGELEDQTSTSKMPSSASELPCSLKREVRVLEKRLDDQFVMRRALEKALGYKPCAVHASSVNCIPEPTEELIKEIAVLELEVICLEKHLLTLYRKAFEQQLSPVNSACDAENNKQPARSFSGILSEASVLSFSTPRKHQPVQSSRMVLARKSTPTASTSEASSEKINIGRSHSSLLHRSVRVSPSANNLARALKPCHTSPLSFVEEGKCMEPGVVSLADILGTRVADHVPQTPNKISEDMIRCIAAIYIRLRDVPSAAAQHAFFPSPCSSFSSASGLSSKYTADVWSWSPRCRRESFTEAWQVQDNELGLGGGEARDSGLQYDSVIEVSALCKGDQRSADVKDMLRKYMSLVQLLESVDLGGMKNEEKLAFWINVHNAMMMHAHIEYGIPQSNSKRILLTKVSYIVSGQRVNAELIEYQILCCRAHSSGQWLRLLLHPKWKSGRDRDEELQGFAVDRPEPLVHFALSSGSYSDPVVGST